MRIRIHIPGPVPSAVQADLRGGAGLGATERFTGQVGSMKFLKWAAVVVLVVLPLAEVAGHLVVQQTDAYLTLSNFVQISAGIRAKVGDHPKMRLHFFEYSIRVSGPSGNAEFSAFVEGSKGGGELNAKLVKTGDWKITSVALDGQEIQAPTINPATPRRSQPEDLHQR